MGNRSIQVVLIGGKCAGERIILPDLLPVAKAIERKLEPVATRGGERMCAMPVREHTYTRRRFIANGREFNLYVAEKMSDDIALELLLGNYRPLKTR